MDRRRISAFGPVLIFPYLRNFDLNPQANDARYSNFKEQLPRGQTANLYPVREYVKKK
jgi:hypothetical protein